MKKLIGRVLIVGILTLTLMGQSLADCRPSYEAEMKTKIEKLQKAKKIGRIITGSAVGGMGVFWGFMGVMLVGPWGVLIGAQFALLGSVVGVPFYVSNKIRKARLNKLGEALFLINQSYGEITSNEKLPMEKLLEQLRPKHPELTLTVLKEKVRALNESDIFCKDGLATPRKISRFVENSLGQL
ncbi:MAG: hypothetical protein A2X86_14080 [Bdellovibrionales bacterium GWA2_49_15]|nr:MAG: hypothetical protein A2X86_14080 [Bdellovibrionales bacterium GWA2_49_15]HAZ11529.1 hypothetical protein [Bdellovibrionales bacterium]